MQNNKWGHTGAILAGGKSKRMGFPKAELVLPNGKKVIEYMVEMVSNICRQVIIVGHHIGEEYKLKNKVTHIFDQKPNLGPLHGLEVLLESKFDDKYLVLACDQPLLTPDLLWKLIQQDSSNITLFQVQGDSEVQPFPGCYPASCLKDIQKAMSIGKNAMYEFIEMTKVNWIPIASSEYNHIKSINTPQEFRELKKSLNNE